MLLLLIIALLGSTVAHCPRKHPKVWMRCRKKGKVCAYRERCWCNQKGVIIHEFTCLPRLKVWKESILVKCPKCPRCKCRKSLQPVCAMNGMTYMNKCIMGCQKKRLQCKGHCPCSRTSKCRTYCQKDRKRFPKKTFVCGTNGKTYDRPCALRCAKTSLRCAAPCTECRRKSGNKRGSRIKTKLNWG